MKQLWHKYRYVTPTPTSIAAFIRFFPDEFNGQIIQTRLKYSFNGLDWFDGTLFYDFVTDLIYGYSASNLYLLCTYKTVSLTHAFGVQRNHTFADFYYSINGINWTQAYSSVIVPESPNTNFRPHGLMYSKLGTNFDTHKYICWADTGVYEAIINPDPKYICFIAWVKGDSLSDFGYNWNVVDVSNIFQTEYNTIDNDPAISKVIEWKTDSTVYLMAVGLQTIGYNMALSSDYGLTWGGFLIEDESDFYDVAWNQSSSNPVLIAVGKIHYHYLPPYVNTSGLRLCKYEYGSWTPIDFTSFSQGVGNTTPKLQNRLSAVAYSDKAYNGIKWLAGGTNWNNNTNLNGPILFRSADGITWLECSLNLETSWVNLINQISWNGEVFIVSGVTDTKTFTKYTRDGITFWDFPTASQSTIAYMRQEIYSRLPTFPADSTIPSVVSYFNASDGLIPESQILLTWGAATDTKFPIFGYQITRFNGSSYVLVHEEFDMRRWQDEGLDSNTVYYYEIRAFDSARNYGAWVSAQHQTGLPN